jgi:hypothetical protein
VVGAAQELDAADRAVDDQVLHVQELTRVHDRLHHHVLLARLADGGHDGAALVERRGHRDRARDVLARPQRGDRLLGVRGDRGVDVDGVDVGVAQHLLEAGEALGDAERVTDLGQ